MVQGESTGGSGYKDLVLLALFPCVVFGSSSLAEAYVPGWVEAFTTWCGLPGAHNYALSTLLALLLMGFRGVLDPKSNSATSDATPPEPLEYIPWRLVNAQSGLGVAPLNSTIVVDCRHPTRPCLTHHKPTAPHRAYPKDLAGDSSSDVVLNAVRSKHTCVTHGAVCFVTCNHFDIDGFISVFSLHRPAIALKHEALLRLAARLGDFREMTDFACLLPTRKNATSKGVAVAAKNAAGATREAMPLTPVERALQICCWLNTVERREFWRPYGRKEHGENKEQQEGKGGGRGKEGEGKGEGKQAEAPQARNASEEKGRGGTEGETEGTETDEANKDGASASDIDSGDESKFRYFLQKDTLKSFEALLQDPLAAPLEEWIDEYVTVSADLKLMESKVVVERHADLGLVVLQLPRPVHYYALFAVTSGFDTVLSLYEDGGAELEQKYTTFVDLQSRSTLPRVDTVPLAAHLNILEAAARSKNSGQKETGIGKGKGTGSELYWAAERVVDSGPLLRLEDSSNPLTKAERYGHPYQRRIPTSALALDDIKGTVVGFLRTALYSGNSSNSGGDNDAATAAAAAPAPSTKAGPIVSPRRCWTWKEVHAHNTAASARVQAWLDSDLDRRRRS